MFGVGLCCLGALRGLCGFCARVELGGLEACGVFAFIFHLLCPCLVLLLLCLPPFMLVVLLCSGCLYLFYCVVFVVSFSLTDYTQKERARRVGASSIVLLCVFRFLYSYRKTPSLCIWLFPVRPVDSAN